MKDDDKAWIAIARRRAKDMNRRIEQQRDDRRQAAIERGDCEVCYGSGFVYYRLFTDPLGHIGRVGRCECKTGTKPWRRHVDTT